MRRSTVTTSAAGVKQHMVRRARFAVVRVAAAFVVAYYLDPTSGHDRRAALGVTAGSMRQRITASSRAHGLGAKIAALAKAPRSIDSPPVMISSPRGIPVDEEPTRGRELC